VAMLTEQYRMHPDISAFPSKFFYEGKIQDHAVLKQQRCAAAYLSQSGERLAPDRPLSS